jgi:hypothetical protein
MKPRLPRFLHLERDRGERPAPESAPPLRDGGRFESLEERREAPPEAAVPDTHLERFRGDAPLALADVPEEARRFPRCAVCESENGRFVKACTVCGADLGTPEQLEYNERLWQQRRQELSRTHADELEALRQHEERRREQEALADRMLEQLRAQEGSPRWKRAASQRAALGPTLLALIPHPRLRWGVLGAALLLPVALWRYGRGEARLAALVLCVIFLGLFLPRGPSRFR